MQRFAQTAAILSIAGPSLSTRPMTEHCLDLAALQTLFFHTVGGCNNFYAWQNT